MSKDDIPDRQSVGKQVDMEIDQRDVHNEANVEPENLRIDSAKLFTQATEQTRMALCLCDPFQDDMPIVYVNEAFTDVTGYSREDAVGQNCRFLQGEDTTPEAIERVRAAIKAQEVTVIDILNYKKDGTRFWNALHVGPIFDDDGELAYFYGSQWDITAIFDARERAMEQERVAEELQHRTHNLFGIITSIISLSSRNESDVATVIDKITDRITALARAHKASIAPGGRAAEAASLRALIDSVMEPYRTSAEGRIKLTGERAELHRNMVTPVGLALHELATNAIKYGSLSDPGGSVCIDWEVDGDDMRICWIERGGPSPDKDPQTSGSGTGSRIVRGVLQGLGGDIDMDFEPEGLNATLRFPFAG
ncbi:PAS domain-containing protein [Qipengyuania marisflavi]|uniref:histidine kinase n=1 Tax=Qipengyuania marisflavi TaxID=2486356 RepID=A0A5S3P767_9SPHN|nr:PAS domain-containing protein [Qipengyuania marisflavi]TMM48997.1 PAS domain-containing protein [Qipengyuania marisflavi]